MADAGSDATDGYTLDGSSSECDDSPTARAFAPGHVTGFFAPHRHGDPERAGSRGAGVALSHGVHATVTPADETTVILSDAEGSIPSVERVLAALDVRATVRLESDLPLGAGFGVSGAAALATALAAAEVADRARSENELVRLAHVAEVEAGTGLGDVVAQARGGVPIRVAPGAPPHGALDGVPAAGRIEYVSLGELSTRAVLDGDTGAIEAAGADALDRLREAPTLARLVECSREFAERAALLPEDVRAVLADVDDAGGRAAMAMLGRSVFAVGDGLSAAGYDPAVCEIHSGGATLR